MNEDFFNLSLNYPTSQLQDFERAGLTKDNVELKDKDYYKQFEQVKNVFKDDTGKFDEKRYNTWYNNVLSNYNDFTNNQYSKNIMDSDVRYVMTDSAIYNKTQGTTPTFVMPEAKRSVDVFGRTTGMVGINSMSEKFNSEREFIQQQMMYDENGKKLDYTPEDIPMWKLLFNPVRQAVYDKDEYNDEGKLIHKKGETKLDSEGLPYMEYIGDRDNSGLEQYQLNPFDVLVKEKSALNPIAIWEDDDLKKNPYAALIKNTTKVGVLLAASVYAPPLATGLALGMAGLALADIVPEYLKTYSAAYDSNVKDSTYYKILNQIQSFSTQFNPTQSDYAQEDKFGLENLSSMMPMVYSQLYQMRGVFTGSALGSKLLGASDNVASTVGKYASSAYMTALGASEMSKEAKKLGLDDDDTAKLLTGATAGMAALYNLPLLKPIAQWAVDETYMGKTISKEIPYLMSFFKDNKNVVKEVIKHESDKWVKTLGKNTVEELTTQEKKEWYKRIPSILKEVFSPNANATQTGFVEYLKAGGAEALEEVTEQGILDGIKLGYNIYMSKGKKFEGMFDPENYALSFIGGAMGGTMFKLTDVLANKQGKEAKNEFNTTVFDLFEQGKTEEEIVKIIDETVPQYVNNKLSTKLDESGNYLPASENNRSQADDVKDFLKQTVRDIKAARDDIGGIKQLAQKYNQDVKNTILDMNLDSTLRDDVSDAIDNIVTAKSELKQLMNEENVDTNKVQQARDKVMAANKTLQDIKNRTYTDHYYQQGLFSINSAIQDAFLNSPDNKVKFAITKDKIAREQFFNGNEGMGYAELNTEQKLFVDNLYKDVRKDYKNNKTKILAAQTELNNLINTKKKDIEKIQSDIESQADFDAKMDEVTFLQSIADKDTLTLNEKTRLSKINLDSYSKQPIEITSDLDRLNKETFDIISQTDLDEDEDGELISVITGIEPKFLNSELRNAYNQYIKDKFGLDISNIDYSKLSDIERDNLAQTINQINDAIRTNKKELKDYLLQSNPYFNLLTKIDALKQDKPLAHQFTKDADMMANMAIANHTLEDADFENYENFDDAIIEYKKKLSMLTYTGLINPEVQALRERLAKTNPAFAERMKDEQPLIVSDLTNTNVLIKHIGDKIELLTKYRDKAFINSKKKMRLVKLEWLKDIATKANTLERFKPFIKFEFSEEFKSVIDDVNKLIIAEKPITSLSRWKEEEDGDRINQLYKELIDIEEQVHNQLGNVQVVNEILESTNNLIKDNDKYYLNTNTDVKSSIVSDSYFIAEKNNVNDRNVIEYIDKDSNVTKDFSKARYILSVDGINYLFYLYMSNPKESNIAVYDTLMTGDNLPSPLQHQYSSLLYTYSFIQNGNKLEDFNYGFAAHSGNKYVPKAEPRSNEDDATKFLYNALVIEGTVGTGKTRILESMNKLLADNKIKYYAPNEKQRENLKKVIGISDANLVSTKDLSEEDLFKEINELADGTLVVLDEVQSFSRNTILNLADNKKLKFVFTGDLQQLGYTEKGVKAHIGSNAYKFSPPKFDFIVRNGYENLPDTISSIRAVLNPLDNVSGVNRNNAKHNINSKYYLELNSPKESENDFNGVYVSNDDKDGEINKALEIMKRKLANNPNLSIAIISGDTKLADEYVKKLGVEGRDNLIKLGSDQIKGSEADYVIMLESAKDFNSEFQTNDKRELEFYLTNIGRAKKGILVLTPTYNLEFKNNKQTVLIERSSFTSNTPEAQKELQDYIEYVQKAAKLEGTLDVKPKSDTLKDDEDKFDDTFIEDIELKDEPVQLKGVARFNLREKLNNGYVIDKLLSNDLKHKSFELDLAIREYILADDDVKDSILERIKIIVDNKELTNSVIQRMLSKIDNVNNLTIKEVTLTPENYKDYFFETKTSQFNPKYNKAYFIGVNIKGENGKQDMFYSVGAVTYTTLENEDFKIIQEAVNKKDIEISKEQFINSLKYQRSKINENYSDKKLTVNELSKKYPNYTFSNVLIGTSKTDVEGTNYKSTYNGNAVILYSHKSFGFKKSELQSKFLLANNKEKIGVLRLNRPLLATTNNTGVGFLKYLFAYKLANVGSKSEKRTLYNVINPVTGFKYIRAMDRLAAKLKENINQDTARTLVFKDNKRNISYSNKELIAYIDKLTKVFQRLSEREKIKQAKEDYSNSDKKTPLDVSFGYSNYVDVLNNKSDYQSLLNKESKTITVNDAKGGKEEVMYVDFVQLANNITSLKKELNSDNNKDDSKLYDILNLIDTLIQETEPILLGVKIKSGTGSDVTQLLEQTDDLYNDLLTVNAIPELPSVDIEISKLANLIGIESKTVVIPSKLVENTTTQTSTNKEKPVVKEPFYLNGVEITDINPISAKMYKDYGMDNLTTDEFYERVVYLIKELENNPDELSEFINNIKNNC